MKTPFLRLAILCAFLLSHSAMASYESYEARDAYSSTTQRNNWRIELEKESLTKPFANFHPFGHLTALVGEFTLDPGETNASIAKWLREHADMFGLPADGTEYEFIGTSDSFSYEQTPDAPLGNPHAFGHSTSNQDQI